MKVHRLLPLVGVALSAFVACWYDVPDVVVDSGLDANADALVDAAPVDASDATVDDGGCNPTAPFQPPTIVFTQSASDVRYPRLSPDERTLYFALATSGPYILHAATRAGTTGPFTNPTVILANVGNSSDFNITVSTDGLVALLSSTRPNVDTDASQLWSTKRIDAAAPFVSPTWATQSSSTHAGDFDPYLVPGTTNGLFYSARLQGTIDIAYALFDTVDAAYTGIAPNAADPTNLNSPLADDRAPVVSADQLRVYFASNRGLDAGGATSAQHIWTSTRATALDGWDPPSRVSELTNYTGEPGWISANDCRLYFSSNHNGTYEIYVASRGQ